MAEAWLYAAIDSHTKEQVPTYLLQQVWVPAEICNLQLLTSSMLP